MNIAAINRLSEAIHYLEQGRDGIAMAHIDEAKALLLPSRPTWSGRPEDDPNRSEADRKAWREARGA